MDYRDLSLLGERIGYIVSWVVFFFCMVVYFELKSMKNCLYWEGEQLFDIWTGDFFCVSVYS